ncbi:unnamed protein product [Bemisia tabaci]|uniref:Guanine nucleotide-binding protein subunit beta-like protein 1 n=1 Tax=Bemisia tabaci TaxID=7038 RepID=A0A9P0EYN7_BEMTA|nr:PREDICTED: guanine nucleotide-binding protein subunit beta-like protein 1 [Bemisia tabaci]CAH0382367.1 unnamed protein product [Bemisia tabaci]
MAKPPPPLFSMKGSMEAVHSLAFKLDDKIPLLFAGTQSGHLHIWNLQVNREEAKFSFGTDPILSIHYVNKKLITQTKVGLFGVWEEENSQWILRQSLPQNFLSFCKSVTSLLEAKPVLACADSDSLIQIFSLETYTNLFSLKNDSAEKLGEVMALRFTTIEGKLFLLAVYENCSLFLWDMQRKTILSKLKISEECPMALDYDESSMRGICGSSDENLSLFTIGESQDLKKKLVIKLTNPGISCIKIRPDKKIVAVGCWDGMIRLYSWRSLKLLAVLDHHDSTIHDVCFSDRPVASWKTNILLAAAGKDCKISIWDLYNAT